MSKLFITLKTKTPDRKGTIY